MRQSVILLILFFLFRIECNESIYLSEEEIIVYPLQSRLGYANSKFSSNCTSLCHVDDEYDISKIHFNLGASESIVDSFTLAESKFYVLLRTSINVLRIYEIVNASLISRFTYQIPDANCYKGFQYNSFEYIGIFCGNNSIDNYNVLHIGGDGEISIECYAITSEYPLDISDSSIFLYYSWRVLYIADKNASKVNVIRVYYESNNGIYMIPYTSLTLNYNAKLVDMKFYDEDTIILLDDKHYIHLLTIDSGILEPVSRFYAFSPIAAIEYSYDDSNANYLYASSGSVEIIDLSQLYSPQVIWRNFISDNFKPLQQSNSMAISKNYIANILMSGMGECKIRFNRKYTESNHSIEKEYRLDYMSCISAKSRVHTCSYELDSFLYFDNYNAYIVNAVSPSIVFNQSLQKNMYMEEIIRVNTSSNEYVDFNIAYIPSTLNTLLPIHDNGIEINIISGTNIIFNLKSLYHGNAQYSKANSHSNGVEAAIDKPISFLRLIQIEYQLYYFVFYSMGANNMLSIVAPKSGLIVSADTYEYNMTNGVLFNTSLNEDISASIFTNSFTLLSCDAGAQNILTKLICAYIYHLGSHNYFVLTELTRQSRYRIKILTIELENATNITGEKALLKYIKKCDYVLFFNSINGQGVVKLYFSISYDALTLNFDEEIVNSNMVDCTYVYVLTTHHYYFYLLTTYKYLELIFSSDFNIAAPFIGSIYYRSRIYIITNEKIYTAMILKHSTFIISEVYDTGRACEFVRNKYGRGIYIHLEQHLLAIVKQNGLYCALLLNLNGRILDRVVRVFDLESYGAPNGVYISRYNDQSFLMYVRYSSYTDIYRIFNDRFSTISLTNGSALNIVEYSFSSNSNTLSQNISVIPSASSYIPAAKTIDSIVTGDELLLSNYLYGVNINLTTNNGSVINQGIIKSCVAFNTFLSGYNAMLIKNLWLVLGSGEMIIVLEITNSSNNCNITSIVSQKNITDMEILNIIDGPKDHVFVYGIMNKQPVVLSLRISDSITIIDSTFLLGGAIQIISTHNKLYALQTSTGNGDDSYIYSSITCITFTDHIAFNSTQLINNDITDAISITVTQYQPNILLIICKKGLIMKMDTYDNKIIDYIWLSNFNGQLHYNIKHSILIMDSLILMDDDNGIIYFNLSQPGLFPASKHVAPPMQNYLIDGWAVIGNTTSYATIYYINNYNAKHVKNVYKISNNSILLLTSTEFTTNSPLTSQMLITGNQLLTFITTNSSIYQLVEWIEPCIDFSSINSIFEKNILVTAANEHGNATLKIKFCKLWCINKWIIPGLCIAVIIFVSLIAMQCSVKKKKKPLLLDEKQLKVVKVYYL